MKIHLLLLFSYPLAECIASEPMVQEPVLTVWDGNGAMYVAEIRSYIQDEAGTGTKTLKNGRIKRLTDTNGEGMYFTSCVSCHGADGRGVTLPGTGMMIAPSLAESVRVVGPVEQFVPVLLNGLMGPIEEKGYEGQFMVPASALGITRDDRLAEALSYIRYA